MIAQVEHIPNLLHLAERFELVGVADPSALVRSAIAERYGVRGFATRRRAAWRSRSTPCSSRCPTRCTRRPCSPALEAGLHVFCEKPLCFTEAEGAAIAAARDRAGRVVQVGYMKRFDPNYEAALAYLPGRRRGPALHLGRGVRPRLVAVRRPPAARAPRRRAGRPDRRHAHAPARAGRRGARGRGRRRRPARLLRPAHVGRRALRQLRPRHARPHGGGAGRRSSAARSSPAARARAGTRVAARTGGHSGTSSRCSCPTSAGTASATRCTSPTGSSSSSSRRRT